MGTERNELPPRQIGDAWSSVRGLLQQAFSTQGIKEIIGKAGLPVFKIQYVGTHKGPFLDEADRLVKSLDPDLRNRFVLGCIEEIIASGQRKAAAMRERGVEPDDQVQSALEEVLARVGYGVSDGVVFPLNLQMDLETASLPDAVSAGIAEALRRYRDGRFSGAITSICGAVDKLTERAFSAKALGDHKAAPYQQRVSKSFAALETEYRTPLQQSGIAADEVKRVWENHKKSVSQAAYVLAAFRREHSDAHGEQNAPKEFVQKSLDCAVFILRSFSDLLN